MDSPDRLLRALSRLGVASSKELMRELGVHQSTVSRLVTAAGEEVCRLGQGRSTRYARRRALPGLGTRLPIHRVRETGAVGPFRELHLLDKGGHWLDEPGGEGELFVGLPPFAHDMRPQGYVGRGFHARHPELGLPPHINDWSDDHCLTALARRGEDCVGDLILGEESLDRWLQHVPEPVEPSLYPQLARRSAHEQPGSSAGGEQPKFLTFSKDRHVLVKYAGEDGAAGLRWKDLLVCEHLALEECRAAGLDATRSRWFDAEGLRFLDLERFDRVGPRGRRGVLSLRALDSEYLGAKNSWTDAALLLLQSRRIHADDERRIRWLDVFGQLIGNSDRHFGNLSFLTQDEGLPLRLAPVYDMLPMVFAPAGTLVVERPFEPRPPTARTLDVWADAARHAHGFWSRAIACEALSAGFRERARQCQGALEALQRQVPSLAP
ncbi:type II toxin-antitoxin system HipA family toxin YjjJ [Myxococcaceae bacterium GXIMD 01537]